MKVAKGMRCHVVSGRGREAIYLGLAYKETKAVWRLARGHTWESEENPHLQSLAPRPA